MSARASEEADFQCGSDDTQTSHLEQPAELLNGRKLREEDWIIYIKENSEVDRRWPSIFRVPSDLKKGSQEGEAYVPQRVSLGPYHYRSAKIPLMKSHKGRAVHRMATRAIGPYTTEIYFLNWAKDEIMLLEDKIRESYEEKIGCDGETLALMLCFDGCFILEILRTMFGDLLNCEMSHHIINGDYYEALFHRNRIRYTGFDILRDILKLENQIPFIVLRKLLVLEIRTTDNVENRDTIEQLLLHVLGQPILEVFYPFNYKKHLGQWSWPQLDGQDHLLGLLHTIIVSPHFHNAGNALEAGKRGWMKYCMEYCMGLMGCGDEGHRHTVLPHEDEDEDEIMNDIGSIPRAVELRNDGIKFKPCAVGIRRIIFDRKSATIYLPPIRVVDCTETLFRNLIALEMCKPSAINYVACYLVLMDRLIDSEEDVALLRKKGIIINYLESDAQVAQLFNGLGKGVILSRTNVFGKLAQNVNVYRKTKWKVHLAELLTTHFSSPWSIIGLVAGSVLLTGAVLQTLYTLLSYYK